MKIALANSIYERFSVIVETFTVSCRHVCFTSSSVAAEAFAVLAKIVCYDFKLHSFFCHIFLSKSSICF